MTPGEVALLLGEAVTLERSRPPDADTLTGWVAAWMPYLRPISFEDAWAAMVDHFDEDDRRLMPAHITGRVRERREQWIMAHPDRPEMPPGWGAAAAIPAHIAAMRPAAALEAGQ